MSRIPHVHTNVVDVPAELGGDVERSAEILLHQLRESRPGQSKFMLCETERPSGQPLVPVLAVLLLSYLLSVTLPSVFSLYPPFVLLNVWDI